MVNFVLNNLRFEIPIIFAAIPTQCSAFAVSVSARSSATGMSSFVAGTDFIFRNSSSRIIFLP